MGFHVGDLLTHFSGEKRTDFLEMSLHHLAAIYLFGGLYLYNVWEIGAVIAYLHDIADITTHIVKTLADTDYQMATVVTFLTHLCIWFYTRNILLPYYIYTIWI